MGLSIQWLTIRKIRSVLRGIPIIPVIILMSFVFCGIFAGLLSPRDPIENRLINALTPPSWQEGGTTTYLLGTDQMGRDCLSRLIHGATISLRVSFIVVFLAGGLGIMLALLSGYFGGWVDIIIMRVTDMMLSMPYLLVAIVPAAILRPSVRNVTIITICLYPNVA